MFVFDPFLLILFIFISSFIPGSILSLAVLKNSNFKLIERILIGCSVGLIIPPAFLLFANFAGVKFSYLAVILSVLLFYVVSLLIFVRSNTIDSLKSLKIILNKEELVKNNEKLYSYLLTFFLLLIVFLAFWIRLQSYTPIFQELDPYYYTYSTYQVLTLGEAPFDDKTAWYPDLKVSHRTVPIMIYLEAMWYSLYTGGAAVDNYLLATVAGIYPPIAAALAVFSLYLLFSSNYKREFALIGAAVASFLPIFLLKLTAGEMEVQPFGFFTMALSLALYAWMLKETSFNIKFSILSILL
ncbi:hypothetical protein HYT84_00645, partial [Candidatus Micrarchaeota archaeon]|nr:hypothetical protein [Candidatus Micrarchaeota archaeon]